MRFPSFVAALCVLPLAAVSVHAEPAADAVPPSIDEPPQRSPLLALVLSAAGASAGVALLSAGDRQNNDSLRAAGWIALELGPSAGHWYAGSWWSPGMIGRGVGTTLFALGDYQQHHCNADEEKGGDSDCWVGGVMLGALGLLVLGGSTIGDVLLAPMQAREFNRMHEMQRMQPIVVPTAIAAPGGLVPGLVVSGSF